MVRRVDKRRILRLFLLPALAGLAASTLAYGYIKAGGTGPAAGQQVMVPMVIAREAIPPRTRLTAEMLTIKKVPQEYAWKGALSSVNQAVGRVTVLPLAEGEPVVKSALALPENKSALAYHVPQGFRATTIAVNELSGVAGRLQVGDRVDVVGIFSQDVAGKPKSILLLENLQVLALGREEGGDPGGKAAGGYKSVTLAVKPEQAVLLALAVERGRIQVLLRPADGGEQRGRLVVTDEAFRN